jgi:dipeptidase
MCTTVVVGRDRSATGSVLLAHSEELGRNAAHRVEICPRRTRRDRRHGPTVSDSGVVRFRTPAPVSGGAPAVPTESGG